MTVGVKCVAHQGWLSGDPLLVDGKPIVGNDGQAVVDPKPCLFVSEFETTGKDGSAVHVLLRNVAGDEFEIGKTYKLTVE